MTEKINTVGRPQKYEESTKVVSFRVPISEENNIRKTVNKLLTELEK